MCWDNIPSSLSLSGQLASAQEKWFDTEYHPGACVTSGGSAPASGKNVLSYATDHRICFVQCHDARNIYMKGCQFDLDSKTCYSHTSDIEAGSSSSSSSNSECMRFLTMAEEVGVCEYYRPPGDPTPDSVHVIPEEAEYRKDFGEVQTARECLNRCLEDGDAVGCEFKRPSPDTTSGNCQSIKVEFKGGSGSKKPSSCISPCTSTCWKLWPKKTGVGGRQGRGGGKRRNERRKRKLGKGKRKGRKRRNERRQKKGGRQQQKWMEERNGRGRRRIGKGKMKRNN